MFCGELYVHVYVYLYIYCGNLKVVTLALTDVTGPDVKKKFLWVIAVCRTAWKEANYSEDSNPCIWGGGGG
jgi:hypothetical protein